MYYFLLTIILFKPFSYTFADTFSNNSTLNSELNLRLWSELNIATIATSTHRPLNKHIPQEEKKKEEDSISREMSALLKEGIKAKQRQR